MAKELEMKVVVDGEEFSRCLDLLRAHTGTRGDDYVQVNYYFDTPDFVMSAAHSMLRVRQKKGALYLQYKNKRERKGSMLLCDEEEAPLSQFPSSVNPARYFNGAPDGECGLLGNLITHRTDFCFPNAVVSLDRNLYFGKTDYEIEIEGEADAIEGIAAFLSPQGESKGGNGKFSRFLTEYRKIYCAEGDQI